MEKKKDWWEPESAICKTSGEVKEKTEDEKQKKISLLFSFWSRIESFLQSF